jgi:hypothetical protein
LLFGLALHVPPFRQRRRLDRHRLNGADELANDRGIDAQAAKHHTPPLPEHHARAVAAIDRLGGPSGVVHRQTPPTTPADQKPGQKGSAAPPGLGAILPSIGVGGKLLLVTLELRPVDVAFVMILQKNLALGERAIVSVCLAGSTFDDLRAVLAFTVGVSASVKGVLQC